MSNTEHYEFRGIHRAMKKLKESIDFNEPSRIKNAYEELERVIRAYEVCQLGDGR
jgi:hypothetical protein